jgi:hypothetical protein
MVTNEQLKRIRDLAQLNVEKMPDAQALDALVLLYDMCEILELPAERLAQVFGAEALTLVTGLVYGEGRVATTP